MNEAQVEQSVSLGLGEGKWLGEKHGEIAPSGFKLGSVERSLVVSGHAR